METRFVSKFIKKSTQGRIFFVLGCDQGEKCWYYIVVSRLKSEIFLKDIARNQNNKFPLTKYGTILYHGWGEQAPKNIEQKISKML